MAVKLIVFLPTGTYWSSFQSFQSCWTKDFSYTPLCRCWWTMTNHPWTFPMLNQINQACVSLSLYATFFNPSSFLIYLCSFKHSCGSRIRRGFTRVAAPWANAEIVCSISLVFIFPYFTDYSLFLQCYIRNLLSTIHLLCLMCLLHSHHFSDEVSSLRNIASIFPMVCVGWHYH